MTSSHHTDREWCDVCGTVDGKIVHEDIEVGNLAGRKLDVANEYLRDVCDIDDVLMVDWDTTCEALDHIQQLRNREIGRGTLADLEEDT